MSVDTTISNAERSARRAAEDNVSLGQIIRSELHNIGLARFNFWMICVVGVQGDFVNIHGKDDLEACHFKTESGTASTAEEVNDFQLSSPSSRRKGKLRC